MTSSSEPALEVLYPSGHRQICKPVRIGQTGRMFYECLTISPDGDNVEYKYLSSVQLERMSARLRRSGGRVRPIEE
jgi:hypothetical protein